MRITAAISAQILVAESYVRHNHDLYNKTEIPGFLSPVFLVETRKFGRPQVATAAVRPRLRARTVIGDQSTECPRRQLSDKPLRLSDRDDRVLLRLEGPSDKAGRLRKSKYCQRTFRVSATVPPLPRRRRPGASLRVSVAAEPRTVAR